MINSPSGSLRAVGKSIIPGKPKLPIVVFESLSAYALFDERKNERAEIFTKILEVLRMMFGFINASNTKFCSA